jgi:CRISPR-associated protein Cas5a/b/c
MNRILLVEGRFLWGFSVKYPKQTAYQDSYLFPPPTTLIGALASPYLRPLRYGEVFFDGKEAYSSVAKLIKEGLVTYASSGLIGSYIVKHSDMLRNIAIPYMQSKYKGDYKYHFAVQAMSRVFTYYGKAILIYKTNGSEDLLRAAWGISSIGSKEGLFYVDNADYVDFSEIGEEEIETPFTAPDEVAECYNNCTKIKVCEISEESYYNEECKYINYIIPTIELRTSTMRLGRKGDGRVIKFNYNGKEFKAIIP